MPDLSHWRTGITFVADSDIRYRGRPVEDLIAGSSISEVIWLLLVGTSPSPQQSDAVRRAVVAAADHGIAAPSVAAARTVASTRIDAAAAIAVGLVAFAGPAHGGAATAIAGLLASHVDGPDVAKAAATIVDGELAAGRRVAGYGHPYHHRDPRVEPLMAAELASDLHRRLARAVEGELRARVGRRLAMNADSAVAAVLLDAGLQPAAVGAVTAIGRCIGLAAHVNEEREREQPFRAPALDTIDFNHDVTGSGG